MVTPKVAVLISTYNPGKYLDTQVQSIQEQVGVEVDIFIRDDGSSHEYRTSLEEQRKKGVYLRFGENIGPAKSFMSLLNEVPKEYSYYAFSDQDDYWLAGKLYNAIKKLRELKKEPGIYCSALAVTDEELNIRSWHRVSERYLFLEYALFHNFCTGNTIVMNADAVGLATKWKINSNVYMHDWWILNVFLAQGVKCIYDTESYIYYRQHERNVLGFKTSVFSQLKYMRLSRGRIVIQKILDQIESLINLDISWEDKKIKKNLSMLISSRSKFFARVKPSNLRIIKTRSKLRTLYLQISYIFFGSE